MAGTVLDRELRPATAKDGIRFTVARDEHDAAIRRLLRENPMRGEVSLSFEREPSYFLGAGILGDHQTILAFAGERLVCMGRCSVRSRWVNGEVRRVGYLADLRLDLSVQGRFGILRRGYQFFRELQRGNPADLYFTSISADNERSLRFLERGLPGMPVYELLGDLITCIIPVPKSARGSQITSCAPGSNVTELVSCLNAHGQQHQLAAFWSEADLGSPTRTGVGLGDFQVLRVGSKLVACAALWDQRSFRQTVIRGYDRRTTLARPCVNLAARLFGTPRLPAIGATVPFGYLSPLAVEAGDEHFLLSLVESAFAPAAARGLDFLAVGFASGDLRLAALRGRFRCREYKTRLYRVSWDRADPTDTLDHGPLLPDLALL